MAMERLLSLQPLGDQAVLAYFARESEALRFAAAVRRAAPAWLLDVVQAYASVAVFFDLAQTGYAAVAHQLQQLEDSLSRQPDSSLSVPGLLHRIPCCYELQLDLYRVAEHTGLDADTVIRLHTETIY